MTRSATLFLQGVVVLVAIGVLAFLLWEPHVEGRNAHATWLEIYFHDPFLAYAYLASTAFFVALYQAFKVLGYAGRNAIFSPAAVQATRIIKLCAIALIGLVVIGEVCFILPYGDGDDRPAGLAMGLMVTFVAAVIATAAATLERVLQNAVDLQSENELTV